jgi:heme-degrading monooxygenase HmoA
MAEPVVLINSFEVPDAEAETFITAWQQARDYLQAQPGYVDTALHQALTPGADFQFVNVARWRTAEDFMTAIQSPGFRQAATDLGGYPAHPALYKMVGS